jgi:hypothetical protein
MKRRRIALLAGLMTVGMVSFGMEEGNAGKLKPNTFSINDRVRFDENRLEVNGSANFNENNSIEIRVRDYSNVGNGFLANSRDSGNEASDRTEMRMRLHTQTSVENMEVRTELKTNTYGGDKGGDKQYFRVQPSLNLFNDVEGLSSVVRAGLAFEHYSPDDASTSNAYSISTSFENSYKVNDYLAVEGNIYYDYTMGGKNTDDKNNVDIEAYVYTNYPLYSNDNMSVTALLEGGFDPYSFGARQFNNLTDASGSETEGHETYVLYAEPSVKATKMLNENNSVYLQGGYYVEQNNKNSTGDTDNTGFVRVGFTSKF